MIKYTVSYDAGGKAESYSSVDIKIVVSDLHNDIF